MKSSELTGMGDEDLARTLIETEKSVFDIRFKTATDRADTGTRVGAAKTTIARIKTEQRKRELKKMAVLSDDQLNTRIAAETERSEGPGKRRAKRTLVRLTTIQAARAAKASAAKGK